MPAAWTAPSTTATSALPRRRTAAVLLVSALAATQLTTTLAATAQGSAWTSQAVTGVLDPGLSAVRDGMAKVIVTAADGVTAAARAVTGAGGEVRAPLPLVGGVSAVLPASELDELAGTPGVRAVTADRAVQFEQLTYDETTTGSAFARSTRATAAWAAGNLGEGVGVAVLDTGISQMNDFAGRLVHGPDLSGEGTLVDTYGHGTVMAGAVGGSGADSATRTGGAYTGVAPKATLVAVKVAGRNGATDVSTVLQGMHWVSAYKDQFNIRVLNLSWGTASTQDPAVDPLNYAVQRLWKQGVVVVVAAGNSGPSAGTIMKPGDDPLVLTVGAYDDKGTAIGSDDVLSSWSSRGPTAQGVAKPDLVAPGRSLVLARSYGSYVEQNNPKALQSPAYIRGSGTSQAAAVTSGLAALLVAARPSLTPDQVKALLTGTALPIGTRAVNDQGAGRVDLGAALAAPAGPALWQTASGSGLGSIEASRGGRNVETACGLIRGEIDVRCEPWSGSSWTGSSWTGSSWTGSSWTGSSWTGSSWTGSSWTGSSWTGSSWTGGAWTGSSWTGSSWTGSSWTGSSWTGSSWTGSSWTGSSWTGSSWTGSSWTASEYEEFLTAFWGGRPPYWKKLAGEASDPLPTQLV